MFQVNPMPEQIDADLLALLRQVDAVKIGHFIREGAMDPGMISLLPRAVEVGTAVTVKAPGADGTIIPLAVSRLRPGDFLIIDRDGDTRHAAWGGMLAYAAKVAGAVGVAIDGVACDIAKLREHGLPTWYRGASALTTQRLGEAGELNTRVMCGGVAVDPGDVVVADESGVVVLKRDEAASFAEKALAVVRSEPGTKSRIDAGEKLADMRDTLGFIRSRGFEVA
ncbi:RraA family protein [Microvirga pudoricolor]|uniref:RraA family protein n=1 Tax=Microvirga pudoricolor TaxID=2778729 RepID=UPI00194E0FB7|nr:hypothetical protein [Microvirga pudoricolor]MBM6593105.1 hypothetical protein [Microvirga pudoricolor]